MLQAPDPVDSRIGARIRQRRETLGMSVEALAERLACDPQRVRDFEEGRARAGATALMFLTHILDVEIGYFLAALVDEPPPASGPQASRPDDVAR